MLLQHTCIALSGIVTAVFMRRFITAMSAGLDDSTCSRSLCAARTSIAHL